MPRFSHLHVHTKYSLLDGAADIGRLYEKAVADDMPAIAITDHGNMFGVFQFVAEASRYRLNPGDPKDKRLRIKPVVGCEFYVVENRFRQQFTREDRDQRFHQVMLAKNDQGYRNLVKLCSLGYLEGLYGKYPRIDKDLIGKYHEGLIATTCCLGGSVPKAILRKGAEEGEKEFRWWLGLFGADYYVEIQRHGIPDQDRVNEVLLRLAAKYQVAVIASNDSHYVEQGNYNAHDILLCINTGEMVSTPSIKEFADDDIQVKNKRFAFYNDQYFFKTTAEMSRLFQDIPEAIDNTNRIVDQIDLLDLRKNILLPNFPLPEGFLSQDEYLRHLTTEGMRTRYDQITPELGDRVRFELDTISRMGFAGYFLIVADFIRAGREMGVVIGPGRGSAAGSVVAYCTGITNIDPIKYNLLFERFLNPDRKSMPDIDTDFDDEGRQKVIDYVVEKYGRNQVAQIVTYGTMAARSSIKDVGRVLSLTPTETALLSKLVPERPGIVLDRLLHAPLTGTKDSLEEVEHLRGQDLENMMKLRQIAKGNDIQARTLREAALLEGSVRNTGIHAAGIIIAPTDLTELMPVCASRESTLMITQFEGGIIENAGVIKMDFLGLKTLSIIRSAAQLVEKNHGIEIDIDRIALDDRLTYNLFQQGETLAIFQFESPGMQKYLRELRPDKLDDLIAMNALFRPGPMDYIPQFIRRKHGLEAVVYDLPEMEEILKETYGVTVYQEQVMLLSQRLAGFSKGDADVLRKAMGKKQKEVLDKMKSQFMQGCAQNGFSPRTCDKIWGDWESFAQYAFNKSHSTCYALVAYQTAYLKAHYPAEFMAAVLNYASNIEKVTFYMEECRRMGLKVLGPDVNESQKGFAVNAQGEIRFGLGGLKGVGSVAVENLLEERQRGGPFRSAFDLAGRVNQRTVNKKSLESLVLSGAFDGFKDLDRAQYFHQGERDKTTGLEKIIRFGNQVQTAGARPTESLFGSGEVPGMKTPEIEPCSPWPLMERLNREREVTGIFLSGNPLDPFRFEMDHYHIQPIWQFNEHSRMLAENPAAGASNGTQFRLAGYVTSAEHKTSQKNKKYGKAQIEDFSGSTELLLLGDDYVKLGAFFQKDFCLFIAGSFRIRPYREDEYEFRISSIQLLEDLKKKQTRQIILSGEASRISSGLVDFLTLHERNHPGKTELRFELTDSEGQMSVCLRGTQRPVEVNDLLTDFLSVQPGLAIQVVLADFRLSKMQ